MSSVIKDNDNGTEPKKRRLKKLDDKISRCGTDEESKEDNEVGEGNNILILKCC